MCCSGVSNEMATSNVAVSSLVERAEAGGGSGEDGGGGECGGEGDVGIRSGRANNPLCLSGYTFSSR